MKTNTKKYNAVISGYFDDFNASRCIADDENSPDLSLTYNHDDTHFGNHMNGEARLNPRYKKAYKDREDGDETHNSGAHEFLTNDVMRDNNDLWEGKAQVSYPDGMAQPNRVQFDGDTALDSYLLITNGYNTGSYYSIHLGDTDITNGRAATTGASYDGSTGDYDPEDFGKTGATWRDVQFAHLCGVHMGEISSSGDSSIGSVAALKEPFPGAILEPIESPSGKPFLAITTHLKGGAPKPVRIMSYNGSLGAATDNDVFGVRMAWRGVSRETGTASTPYIVSTPAIEYTLSFGFEKANYTEDGGFTGTPAASHTFTTSTRQYDSTTTEAVNLKTGYQDRHPWNRFVRNLDAFAGESDHLLGLGVLKGEDEKTWSLDKVWNDIEIAFDWDAGTYSVLHDGETISSGSIGTNASTGQPYAPDEVYGWQLDATITPAIPSVATEATKVCTLIDRAYLWRDLSTTLTTTLEKMTCSFRSNGLSQMTLSVTDDDDELPIYSLFKKQRNELQELMLFRDGLDRCIWRGHLESVSATQKVGEKRLDLSARDFAAALDRSIPIWEIGQSSNTSEDEPEGWRPYESTNMIQKMYFGASKLERGKSELGISKPDYRVRLDSRARLNSAHPIQLYNEGGGAPSEIWKTEVLSDIQGFEEPPTNYANPQSLTNPLIVHSTAHGYLQGESITISGTTSYDGTYTVNDPSTDYFYIDKAYTATGTVLGLHNGKPFTYPNSHGPFTRVQINLNASLNSGLLITVSDTELDANGERRTDAQQYYSSGGLTLGLTEPTRGPTQLRTMSAATNGTSNKVWWTDYQIPGLANLYDNSGNRVTHITQDKLSGEATYVYNNSGTFTDIEVAGNFSKRNSARVYDGGSDWIHADTNTGATPITSVYFTTGDADLSQKFYVGAKVAIWINTGTAPSVYQITGISGLSASPYEATVSYVSGGTLNWNNLNNSATGGSSGDSGWALIDDDLDFCNETGYATLSAAKLGALPTNISRLLRYRNIHARWIQDLPKSLWFQKTFGVIEKDAVDSSTTALAISPGSYTSGQTVSLTSAAGFDSSITEVAALASSGGVGEFVNADGTVDSFTFSGLASLSGGKYQSMTGVKFFNQAHASGTTVRLRSIRSDYRHIWVLWADMRNDGTADAGSGLRKTDFGLLLPTPDKYKLSIEYTDQEQPDGEPIHLTDLHIGEDANIWELDSTLEPESRGTWSALGSDSESETEYHNWENKAGSFVVVDTSKFWNLNTEANGGKIGQRGGGRTDLQDYFAVNAGVPSMMDNFWLEGMASYKNTDAPFATHPDQLEFVHDASPVVADYGQNVTLNGYLLQVDDASEWADSGVGRIVGVKGSGQSRTVYQFYYAWRSKNTITNQLQEVQMVYLTAAYTGNQAAYDLLIEQLWDYAGGVGTHNAQPQIVVDDYEEITAYNTLAPLNHMRFMMTLTGYIKDPASNTSYEHDKVRFLNAASTMKNWLGRSNTAGTSDIQNVPITKNMATAADWVYSSSAGLDTFSSVTDARGNTFLGCLQKIKEGAGSGEEGNRQTFTYQIGPDGRIELRPGYSSFHEFDRNTLKVSDFRSNMQGQITNVRVYFNEQKSFVDFPTTYTDENIRWSILDKPNIGTLEEALSVAKQHYERSKKSITSITAEVLRGNDDDIMLGGARYGYISDPARMSFGGINPHGRMSNSWFPGMVNALDGNIGTSLEPSYSGGLDIDDNYYWYGANSLAHAMQIVHLPKDFPKFSNTTGNQLRFAIYVNGFATGTKTDLKTASELVKFNLAIFDPIFVDSSSRTTLDGTTDYSMAAYGAAIYGNVALSAGYGHSAADFREIELDIENGYREILIPKTYWADGTAPAAADRKIIVSFNKEYLKALCRNRCGSDYNDIADNAHSSTPFGLTESSPNTDSIFPLGIREYDIMGGLTDERAIWYAPRLHVVDDLNYRVSTALKYTDSAYGYNEEPLILNNISWVVDNLGYEKVQMGLTTDESTFLSSFSTFTKPNVGQGDIRRPAASGRDSSGGGNTGGRGSTEDPVSDGGEQNQPYKPLPPPQRSPGGTTGQQRTLPSGQFSVLSIGASNMTQGAINRFKGALDLPSGMSNHSILGSKRPMINSIGQSYIENPDTLTPTSGTAAISSDGFSFPGVMSTDDTQQPEVSEYQIMHTVPMGAADNTLQISINASIKSLEQNDITQFVVLGCIVKCLETGDEKTSEATIDSLIADNTKINLFSQAVNGADVSGNTLEITLFRKANQGEDTAAFKTLKVHSVLTKIQKHNNIEPNMGEFFGF